MTPVPGIAFANAARGARRWLLWLALLLAAAHCVATWHVYSHGPGQPAEHASKGSHAAPDACVLCLAAVGIGGAPSAPAGWHVAGMAHAEPALPPDRGQIDRLAARPYAIRAPPTAAS